MARKYIKIGGVRINRDKTPDQIVKQLNRMDRLARDIRTGLDSSIDYVDKSLRMGNSSRLKKFGIEFDKRSQTFSLNRKGYMNAATAIGALAGTNG